VVARNWRPPQGGGEIDLIAWERGSLVFVEVKTRLSGVGSAPERDIDNEKMLALRRAARDYIRRAEADASTARFDVLSIVGETVEHLRDAFPLMPCDAG
jgi:putative endonuclease